MTDILNICHEIKCPYDSPLGCQRYCFVHHCHVAHPEPGLARGGVLVFSSEYWQFGDPNVVDMEKIRADQDAWLKSPDEIKWAKAKKEIEG